MRRRLLLVLSLLGLLAGLPAPAGAASTPPDWPGYHGDLARSGYSASVPAVGTVAKAWSAGLDGGVYASPIVARGVIVVATQGNSLYGFDRNGHLLWRQKRLAPVPRSAFPCGNVDPVGITGTPVYYPGTGRVYAVMTTRVNGRVAHFLAAVNPLNGGLGSLTNVDIPGQDPTVENQRGALAAERGRVLITYGGHAGDCGSYHGYLVSVPLTGGPRTVLKTGTQREAGMWQPSGPAIGGDSTVYVVTGNGAATSGPWDGGNAVHRVNPINVAQRYSYFAPADWAEGNRVDADLGSSGATLIGRRVWTQGKTNVGYLLDSTNLGGIGHPLATVRDACARQFGGSAVRGSSAYLPCTDGVRKITVSGNSVALGWKAASNVTGSPVVGGGAVWSLDPAGGVLYALRESDGGVVAKVSVGTTTRFATPALWGNLVLVGTTRGIVAVRSS